MRQGGGAPAGAGPGAGGTTKGVALTGAAAARAMGVMGDVRCQSLDVLADVLKRFGAVLTPAELAATLTSLQKALSSATWGWLLWEKQANATIYFLLFPLTI